MSERHLSEAEQVRLESAMELPEPAARALKVLLARRFQLEQVLLELADRTYLTGRLADLYGEGPGTYVTWKGMYGDALPALLEPDKAATRNQEVRPNAAAVKRHSRSSARNPEVARGWSMARRRPASDRVSGRGRRSGFASVGQAEHNFADDAIVDHEVERTRLQLKRLLREKEAQDQVMRARQELINRAVPKTICVVGLMSAALAATSFGFSMMAN